MEIVAILVPVMLVLVVLGLILFSWAVKNGQYDDLEGPAHRILYDDDSDMIPTNARAEDEIPAEGESEQATDPEQPPKQP